MLLLLLLQIGSHNFLYRSNHFCLAWGLGGAKGLLQLAPHALHGRGRLRTQQPVMTATPVFMMHMLVRHLAPSQRPQAARPSIHRVPR